MDSQTTSNSATALPRNRGCVIGLNQSSSSPSEAASLPASEASTSSSPPSNSKKRTRDSEDQAGASTDNGDATTAPPQRSEPPKKRRISDGQQQQGYTSFFDMGRLVQVNEMFLDKMGITVPRMVQFYSTSTGSYYYVMLKDGHHMKGDFSTSRDPWMKLLGLCVLKNDMSFLTER